MVFHRIRILPVLVIVAMLALSLRVGDILTDNTFLTSAQAGDRQDSGAESNTYQLAQLESGAGKDTQAGDQGDQAGNKEKNQQERGVKRSASPIGDIRFDQPEGDWPDASDTGVNMSDDRLELYQDLANRRKELDKRAQALNRKQALLKAAEQELDRKYEELSALQRELKALLEDQSQEEKERIRSLVKVYEGMKAKDAARIFNTLDMGVLVEVISRMSERRIAPILAEMQSDKARNVTVLLSRQKKLPDIPASIQR